MSRVRTSGWCWTPISRSPRCCWSGCWPTAAEGPPRRGAGGPQVLDQGAAAGAEAEVAQVVGVARDGVLDDHRGDPPVPQHPDAGAGVQPCGDARVAVGAHHVVEREPERRAVPMPGQGSGRQSVADQQQHEVLFAERAERRPDPPDLVGVGEQEVLQERGVRTDRDGAEVAVRAEFAAQEPGVDGDHRRVGQDDRHRRQQRPVDHEDQRSGQRQQPQPDHRRHGQRDDDEGRGDVAHQFHPVHGGSIRVPAGGRPSRRRAAVISGDQRA